jgi:hypothetical protein
LGLSGFAKTDEAAADRPKNPSNVSSEVSAAAPNPQPVSQRNSRRVRPQKSRLSFFDMTFFNHNDTTSTTTKGTE